MLDPAKVYAEDPDNQWHPASLTKIMTAYLAFEAIKSGKLKLDQPIAVQYAHYLGRILHVDSARALCLTSRRRSSSLWRRMRTRSSAISLAISLKASCSSPISSLPTGGI